MKIFFKIILVTIFVTGSLSALYAQINAGPDLTICQGETINLNAVATGGYGTDSYSFEVFPYQPETYSGGTPVTFGGNQDDQIAGPFQLGFQFCFFNTYYSQFYIGSNGWVGFSTSSSWTTYTSQAIPSTASAVPKNCIMAPWQDWHPGVSSSFGPPYVFYKTIGTAPNRKLVVYWNQCPMYQCTTTRGSFQIVLNEQSSIIENHLTSKPNCTTWSGGTATQGVHNSNGTIAFTATGRNSTQWVVDNESTRFVPSGIKWYTGGFPGGTIVGYGTELTANPLVTTTYTAVVNTCGGQVFTDDVIVTVVPQDNANFSYGSSTLCQSGNSGLPVTTFPGGNYTAVPPGLSINPTTGNINLESSTPGAYTVTHITNGFCPDTASIVLNVALLSNEYSFLYAPIVSIGNVQKVPGQEISIPVITDNFVDAGVGEYYIEFNPSVLTFIGIENAHPNLNVTICNNCSEAYSCCGLMSEYIISYVTDIDLTHSILTIRFYHEINFEGSIIIPNGEILFELNFEYNNGFSDLIFVDGNYAFSGNGICTYPVFINEPFEEYYVNGSISPLPITTNLELNLEGLYNPAIGEMRQARGRVFPAEVADEITISIAQSTFPYSFEFVVDSVELSRNGNCSIVLPGNLYGDYYIVISHRNSIQTWSKYPVSFNQDTVNYVFSDNIQKAYNNNLKLVTDKYCIYAGDINQDGFVDSGDMTILDNESNQFVMGYNPSDINGDVFTDSGDIVMADNNIYTFTTAYQPGSGVPEVSTAIIHNITATSAVSGGEVIVQGTSSVLVRGICWNTSPNPTTANSTSENGSGAGVFTSTMTNLQPNTTYYVRAYATNSETTAYGYQLSFKTEIAIPFLSSTEITELTPESAVCGGTIISDGGASITQRGVCWSVSPEPEITDNITNDGTGSGVFVSNLSGLNPNTTYYLRAYATNSAGTGYGNELEFTTPANLAELTTEIATNITSNSATSGGTVTNDGGAMITSRGVCYSQSPNPNIANDTTINGVGSGSFISQLTGLQPNVMYYVRAYATNLAGTAYGNEVSFTTNAELPSLTTEPITSITGTTAISGGIVTGNGGATITQRGICWSTAPSPTLSDQFTSDGSGMGTFISNMTGLNLNTTYYVRAYAINSAGTAYGNEVSFTTALFITGNGVTDIEGNTYSSIILGTQEWMGENLKVALYNNGDSIQQVFTNTVWSGLSTGAWCWMNNDNQLENPYGKLYNYNAVTDSRNVCPAGWRMPNDAEWTILTNYLGGTTVAGGKMKSIGTDFWNSPNTGATNTSNFSGLPGGYRTDNGTFGNLGSNGIWWSSTELNTSIAWYRSLLYNSGSSVRSNNQKKYGFSVRCIREISLPTLTTTEASNISRTMANSGGNITDAGGTNILEKGVCWSTSQNPTINDFHTSEGNSTGEFNSSLYNLSPSTIYYLKAYATNQAGTAYGNEVVFTTSIYSQGNGLSDIDGNNYTSVIIGEQEWMAESLKVSRYLNNDSIPKVANMEVWSELNTGAYCYMYNYEPNNINGKLYNGYAINNSKGLCPLGWRIPLEGDWDTLINYLGGVSFATAIKLIEDPHCEYFGTTNESGFSAKLQGYRDGFGYFEGMAYPVDYFWSLNNNDSLLNNFNITCSNYDIGIGFQYVGLNAGCSVRCIKDVDSIFPLVITNYVSEITTNSALVYGEVSLNGVSDVLQRGICWGYQPNPTISENYTINGEGLGIFSGFISQLTTSTYCYARAYAINSEGISYGRTIKFMTSSELPCVPFTVSHSAGLYAPVSKTITYNVTLTDLTGSEKCWITQNLGADHQAISATDDTEASAGWYWQFNRKQGFKHDGTILTPNTTWINSIIENSDWMPPNDPCSLLLGSGWRLPTITEWDHADETGGWNNYNETFSSVLKLHAAGLLDYSSGSLFHRGYYGNYWSSSQFSSDFGSHLFFYYDGSYAHNNGYKAYGFTTRCQRD